MSEFVFETSTTENSRIRAEKEKYSREYIEDVYDELMRQHGIIMLPVEYSPTIDKIKDITEEYKNMVRFVVNVGGEKFVVLRYKPIIQERLDIKEILKEADEAFKSGDYKTAKVLYFELLTVFSKPSSFIYSRTGMSLYKLGKKKQAIDYLLMANYMAKKEERDVDYTDLINKLRFGSVDEIDKKISVNMSDSDFTYWTEGNFHGVDNFDEINDYILLKGVDVETACKELGISREKANIVKLLYAREFYMRKDVKKGDQFLKAYEESEYKTTYSKSLYDEIKRTKKIYVNRKQDSSKKLLLSLQPGKPKKDNNS